MSTKLPDGRWDALKYFSDLTARNKLCREHDFRCFAVSDLHGLEEAVNAIQQTPAFVCVSDISDGMMALHNTPHIRQVKTVFLAMRHSVQSADWAARRAECFDIMREVFRQFMSDLVKQRRLLEQGNLFLDDAITFSEINRYFLSGCACAYFQIGITAYSDLQLNPDEWTETPGAIPGTMR